MDIRHIQVTLNYVADMLSLADAVSMPIYINVDQLLSQQPNDPDLRRLPVENSTLLTLKLTVKQDSLVTFSVVPGSLRRAVFHTFHGLLHPSRRSIVISQKFVYKRMRKDMHSVLTRSVLRSSDIKKKWLPAIHTTNRNLGHFYSFTGIQLLCSSTPQKNEHCLTMLPKAVALLVKDWVDVIPTVLLDLRTFKEGLGTSSAEMVHGTTLTLPGEKRIPSL